MDITLVDRMKSYEDSETDRRVMRLLPVIARMDGIGFSKFTKNLEKPFDKKFSDTMVKVTRYLIEEFGATCGYTQSDEITLAWHYPDFKSEIYGGYKIQKLLSHLAARTTAEFNSLFTAKAAFDARVWNVPNLSEATNVFLWRQQDGIRNSIQMVARTNFSHSECYEKNCEEMKLMLNGIGINWESYPDINKYGTFFTKKKIKRKFSSIELEELPLKHQARINPDIEIERILYNQFSINISLLEEREKILFNERFEFSQSIC